MYVSIKPKAGSVLTESEKETIKRDILSSKSVVGIIPDIIDPEYTYVRYDAKFSYDKTKTSQKAEDIKALILAYLTLYGEAACLCLVAIYTLID